MEAESSPAIGSIASMGSGEALASSGMSELNLQCYRDFMTAVAWTAIGLLAATLFGNFYWLSNRIDGLAARMEAGFDRVDVRCDAANARFDAVNARFDRVDERFDRVDSRFDAVNARLDAVNARMDDHLRDGRKAR